MFAVYTLNCVIVALTYLLTTIKYTFKPCVWSNKLRCMDSDDFNSNSIPHVTFPQLCNLHSLRVWIMINTSIFN